MVAQTIAQQFTPMAEGATHPFQYALSTRVARALTELDPRTTILSIDRVGGAFNNIERSSGKWRTCLVETS